MAMYVCQITSLAQLFKYARFFIVEEGKRASGSTNCSGYISPWTSPILRVISALSVVESSFIEL